MTGRAGIRGQQDALGGGWKTWVAVAIGFYWTAAAIGAQASGIRRARGPDLSGASDPLDPNAWQTECIYCRPWFDRMSNRGAAFDSNGWLHAAYGAERLYYGSMTEGGWVVEVVDDVPDTGLFAAMALDSTDQPHIVYYDLAEASFQYAFQDDLGWNLEPIPYPDADPTHPASFALDGQDRAHLALYNPAAMDLIYGQRSSSGWSFSTVDSAGDVGRGAAIALDSTGHPFIAYLDATHGCLKVASTPPAWALVSFCDPAESIEALDVAVDSNGYPAIASVGQLSSVNSLTYRSWDGAQWDREDVPTPGWGEAFDSISLTLDGSDAPHVSFDENAFPAYSWSWGGTWLLTYATRSASGWGFADTDAIMTDSESRHHWHTTILIDPTGNPAVLYKRDADLLYLVNDPSTGWQESSLATSGFTGTPPSFDWHPDGYAHASFYDVPAGKRFYTSRLGGGWAVDDAAISGVGGGGNPDVSQDTVLLSEPDGLVHLFWVGGGRHVACLNYSFGSFYDGPYCTLSPDAYDAAIDGDGVRHLAAFDGAQLLYYTMAVDGTWSEPEIVDSAGSDVSLDVDSQGTPHIVYAGSPLNYAVRTPSGWDLGAIPGAAGEDPDLQVDALDHLQVAYHDSSGHLAHAAFDGGSWSNEVVDPSADVGAHPSLAIDGQGGLWISYYDAAYGDLKVAHQSASSWETAALVTDGDVGLYSSLALDAFGFPKIAYLDLTNHDLKYVYQEFAPTDRIYFPFVAR